MAARSRPFFLSLGTTNGERVPVEINGRPVEFDSPGFKGSGISKENYIVLLGALLSLEVCSMSSTTQATSLATSSRSTRMAQGKV